MNVCLVVTVGAEQVASSARVIVVVGVTAGKPVVGPVGDDGKGVVSALVAG